MIFTSFAQQKAITENEKIQFAMLMNQVQYATSSIILNKDRESLDKEFDFIINQIDKSKLYDFTIKSSYTDLLETLKELKLTENEKCFVMEQSEREKKQAYTKAFSSFGSVFNRGGSPASLIASISYAGISAGLNIMSAKYDVDNRLREQMFRLEQKELEKIDSSRINLFKAYTEIITSYGIPIKYEISEMEMQDLIKQLAEKQNDSQELICILEEKKRKFDLFPVFWFQLGAQYQITGNYAKALECYEKFEDLKKNYSYLRTDPYYISVSKNKIEILKKQGLAKNKKAILEYLRIIEDNLIPENSSENRLFLAGNYYELGQNEKAKELLRLNLSRNEFYAVSSDILALIEYEESRSINTLNPALLLELSRIEFFLNPGKDKSFRVSIPKKFGAGKFAYVKYLGKEYPYPYELDSQDSFCNVDLAVDYESENLNAMNIVLLSRNNQIIQIELSTEYIKKNDKVLQLLKEVDMTLNDIEPCLIKDVIKALEDFSYKPKEDKEYLDLVESHKRRISKQTSKEQKQVFEKEENDKLEELKIKGRLRAITARISEVTKDLYKYPFFVSKVSFDAKENALVYSYKSIRYYDDIYTFNKYGIGTKSSVASNDSLSSQSFTNTENLMSADAQYNLAKRYITGNEVEKNAEYAFNYLILSAINGNSTAQFDLATVYSDFSSEISKFFIERNIVISGTGLINSVKNIVTKNSSSENEKIATFWFQKAANAGHGPATYEMAKRYETGLGIEKKFDLAQDYYKEAYYTYGILDAEKKIKK